MRREHSETKAKTETRECETETQGDHHTDSVIIEDETGSDNSQSPL